MSIMMTRTLLFLVVFMLSSVVMLAQFSKTVHNSFEADEVNTISLDLAGEVSVEEWAGNTVLVETQIRLYNASKGIFNHFVETEGRYDVLAEVSEGHLNIYSKDKVRKVVQTKNGQTTEEILVRVLIPKKFSGEGVGPYTRENPDSGK